MGEQWEGSGAPKTEIKDKKKKDKSAKDRQPGLGEMVSFLFPLDNEDRSKRYQKYIWCWREKPHHEQQEATAETRPKWKV